MASKPGTIGNWQPPKGTENCPDEKKLNEWIQDPENSEAKAHLAECPTCSAIVAAARQASNDEDRNLQAFMLHVRLSAQREAEQNASMWKVSKNYFTASYVQTGAVVAGVIAVALVATTGLWHRSYSPEADTGAAPIILHKNDRALQQAFNELHDSYTAITSDAANDTASKSNAAAQIQQLNQTLSKVEQNQLPAEQKQELDTLKTQYQAAVYDRLQPKVGSAADPASAQNIQTDFFNTYASYLVKEGQPLTLSPDVTLKSRGTTFYVFAHRDVAGAKDMAANQAVQDLQARVPGVSIEYKSAEVPAAAASNTHSD